MTSEHHASRTLVKSPPELWAECSDAGSLARHIGEFGEIRITRLEPETSVAWEGEHASGTVVIEPSGWGTRVTLTVRTKADGGAVEEAEAVLVDEVVEVPVDDVGEAPVDAVGEEALVGEIGELPDEDVADPPVTEVKEKLDAKMEETSTPEPDPAVDGVPAPARGRWKRLIGRTRGWFRASAQELETVAEAEVEPPPAAVEPEAVAVEPEAVAVEPEPVVVDPEPVAVDPEPVVVDPEPVAVEPEPVVLEPEPMVDPDEVLAAALDSLGQAHHRPFSRA